MNFVVDEIEELIHPFWLGLLMLFGVVVIVGSICFLRKKCGKKFLHFFNRLRGREDLNEGKQRIEIEIERIFFRLRTTK